MDRNLPPRTWIQTDSSYMINAAAWLNQQDTVDVCQGRTAVCPLDEPSLSACGPAAALTRPLHASYHSSERLRRRRSAGGQQPRLPAPTRSDRFGEAECGCCELLFSHI